MSRQWGNPSSPSDLADLLKKGLIIVAGEGQIDLSDTDPVFVGLIWMQEGYGPHVAAIYVQQNRFHAGLDSALQHADDVFDEWALNGEGAKGYKDHVKELQEEWGEDWMDIFNENKNGSAFGPLDPSQAANALRAGGKRVTKHIEIGEFGGR